MTGLSLGMVVEGLVALLLLLTIGYCVTLNRRLQLLRADEEMLRATISELITATEIAERAILGLKATANDCEKNISTRLAEAGHASQRLSEQVEAGDTVFQKIAQITEAARRPAQQQPRYVSSAASQISSRQITPPQIAAPQNLVPQNVAAQSFAPQNTAPMRAAALSSPSQENVGEGTDLQQQGMAYGETDIPAQSQVQEKVLERMADTNVTSTLINAAEEAALRVQKLRRMTGVQAA